MPRKKRDTPEQAAAKAAEKRAQERRAGFESVGLSPEAADLDQNEGVVVEQMKRTDAKAGERGNEKRARRDDVFDMLLRSEGVEAEEAHRRRAALVAVRRLEKDILIRMGDGDRGQSRVDSGFGGGRTDAQIDAGIRLDAVLARIGRRDAELLSELISPFKVISNAPQRWRVVAVRLTGELNAMAQAARIRGACDNLAEAFFDIDRKPRRAAAA